MNYKRLGPSDLKVSTICFGCMALGKWGWGEDVDDAETTAAVEAALDLGINFFDTADVYGQGYSETLLARALGPRRHDVVIATKVGNRWNADGQIFGDLSRDYILKAVDDSLRRLNIDKIDLYQVHRPDPNTLVRETMDALLTCVEQGKVRYIGLSNMTTGQIEEYKSYGAIVSLQPPLNLLYRFAEVKLLPYCQMNGIGVITYSPLAKGLLTGKFTEPMSFPKSDFRSKHFLFQRGAFARSSAAVQALSRFAAEKGRTVAQLAVAWVLAHPAVTSVIVGAKRPAQIRETAAAFSWNLSEDDLKQIDRIVTTAEF